MTNQEKATLNFLRMNCNQSVLAVYGPQYGLSEEMCFNVGLSFGGGMGKQGKTCGAATGAYVTIGLWSSKQCEDRDEQKRIAAEKVKEFNIRFVKKFKSIECKSLLEFDMSVPSNLKVIQEEDLFNKICPSLVSYSTVILDEILN